MPTPSRKRYREQRVADPDPHYFWRLAPDPHQKEHPAFKTLHFLLVFYFPGSLGSVPRRIDFGQDLDAIAVGVIIFNI